MLVSNLIVSVSVATLEISATIGGVLALTLIKFCFGLFRK